MTFKLQANFQEIKIHPQKSQLNFKHPKKSVHFVCDWTEHEDDNYMFGIKNNLVKNNIAQIEISLSKQKQELMQEIKNQLSQNIETIIYMKGKNCLHLCKIDSITVLSQDNLILNVNDIYLDRVDYEKHLDSNVLAFKNKEKDFFTDFKWSNLKRQCTKSYTEAQTFLKVGIYKGFWESMSLYSQHYLTQTHLLKISTSTSKGIEQRFKNMKSGFINYHNAIISELNDIFINPVKSFIDSLDKEKLKFEEIISQDNVLIKRINSLGDFLNYCDKAPFECYRILKILDKSLSEESLLLQHAIRQLDCHITFLLRSDILKKINLLEKLINKLSKSNIAADEVRNIEMMAFLEEFTSSNTQVNLIFKLQELKGSNRIEIKDTFDRIELLVA